MTYSLIRAICVGFFFVIVACEAKKTEGEANQAADIGNKIDLKKQNKSIKEVNEKPHIRVKRMDALISTGPSRVKTTTKEKYSAAHILLMHEKSKRRSFSITRTKQEAKKIADDLFFRLKAGRDFEELARKFSDCPSGKKKGGNLGIFREDQADPEFITGLKSVSEGEITAPVESFLGYHIIKRQIVEEFSIRHIFITYDGSLRKSFAVKRKKEDAERLIAEIFQKIANGADFAKLAQKYSDCPSGKIRGGSVGRVNRGMMGSSFDDVAFSLRGNEVSKVVETDFGYHIIQRMP